MEYRYYTSEDFVFDDQFRQWVLHQKNTSFWEQFLKKYPHKADELQQAKQIILTLENEKEKLSPQEEDTLLRNIHLRIEGQKIPQRKIQTRPWLSIAASLSAIVFISALTFWWLTRDELLTYTTAFGEVEQLVLPDGSTVTLNANSELSWLNEADHRVVKLKGEAFFEVKKKADGQKFIVKSGDLLVEVLGTSFNVKQRREKTQVVLTSGKVALHHPGSGAKALMQPGDMVSLEEQSDSFQHQQVNPALYTSWTDQKIVINNTTLGEIAATIEDTYGYEVHISGEELLQRKFTSTTTVPLSELETLLRLIEITFEVEVRQQDQQIHIVPKKNRQ